MDQQSMDFEKDINEIMKIVQKGGDHCLKFFGSFGKSEKPESQLEDSCMFIKNEINSSFSNSDNDRVPDLG